jgi:hypothetical protein
MHPGRNTNYDCRPSTNKAVVTVSETTSEIHQQREQQRHHQLYSSPKDEIVSFMDTDLDAVVALILKDPARFQLALQSGTLHQEL